MRGQTLSEVLGFTLGEALGRAKALQAQLGNGSQVWCEIRFQTRKVLEMSMHRAHE